MEVCYSGGDVPQKTICLTLNLKIRGVDFTVNPMILESKDLDVILGMDLLSKHKGLIDCAKRMLRTLE
jgi:hypothetical protein